ncbi:hypothetical protein [Marinovum algicola]|uniref:hypothetical protein n=1 Tax=Marinovum TaxID=367771 RepID=UPI00352B8412
MPYIGQNTANELLILVGCALCATFLRFADLPLARLLIGFILGPPSKNNFSRAMQFCDGVSFICDCPMTLGLPVRALILVVLPSCRARNRAAGGAKGD